jgi:WG containing repeat
MCAKRNARMGAFVYAVASVLTISLSSVWAADLFVVERDGKYGFSDKYGKVSISAQYRDALPFLDGLAPVLLESWGFIDSKGSLIIQPSFSLADNFSEGLAAVHKAGKAGFIGQDGRFLIKPRFKKAGRFSEGVAPVTDGRFWFFIDQKGAPVPNLEGFEDAKSFSAGTAAVRTSGEWRFIDHAGVQRIPGFFASVGSFSDGLAPVREIGSGKFGYIDQSGKEVIASIYDSAESFSEGLAAVEANGKWGFIDKNGVIQVASTFPSVSSGFNSGLALVGDRIRRAALYIDPTGKPRFYKSVAPGSANAGVRGLYKECTLTIGSDPSGAEVYLVPNDVWDFGIEMAQPPPSKLDSNGLKAFLNEHFDFHVAEGPTDRTIIVDEQNYVALFFLHDKMEERRVTVYSTPPAGVLNAVSVKFQ